MQYMSQTQNDRTFLSLFGRLVIAAEKAASALEEIADNTRPAEVQAEFEYDDPDRVPDFMRSDK